MASAMRKMAVYLGLVEDDHRYVDGYDSYDEYEEFEEQADRSEGPDDPDGRPCARTGPGRQLTSHGSRRCTLAPTMKHVPLGSTSARGSPSS